MSQKLPWSFRIRQAWELIVHGTDTRYEDALNIIQEISVSVIVPPMMTEQANR